MNRVLVALAFLALGGCGASGRVTRLSVGHNPVDVREGKTVRTAYWTLSKTARPDVYSVALDRGERREVCFLAEREALCRTVGVGDRFDFVLAFGGFDYPTRLEGTYVPPAAVFDAAYQAAHRGKLRVSVPEVYELVNIAIALTPTVAAHPGLAVTKTPYFEDVERRFGPLRQHPFVRALDEELARNLLSRYSPLKMNANAFVFEGERIVRSPVYDRTGFPSSVENDLVEYLPQMQDFADQGRFRQFYAAHRELYAAQIATYEHEIDLGAMVTWLRGQFPAVAPYDTISVVFSPLVGSFQSVTWFESNGFRELQPHINFPYGRGSFPDLSPAVLSLERGYIAFTELNHGFINPTAEPFAPRIARALRSRTGWAEPGGPAQSYDDPQSFFDEMLNWGLISLYLVDKAPPGDLDVLLARLERRMVASRGFLRFPELNRFLVALYRQRPPGATVASLYPQIVAWFEAQAVR
jgi:Domain of unknown function (DUF4932)